MEFQEEVVIHLQQVPLKEILEELDKVVDKRDHLAAEELVKQVNQDKDLLIQIKVEVEME